MKKLILSLLLFWAVTPAHAFSPVRQVQISTNAIPQQGGYYNVVGGTVTNFANTNQVSSGTYTISGGTFNYVAGVTQGTKTDTSTTTLQGAVFNGTSTDNSTNTHTGANSWGNQKLTNISSATVASDAARYNQVKLIQEVDAAVTTSSATTSATYGKTNIAVTISVLNATSKVKITTSFAASQSALANACDYKITKNGNAISFSPVLVFGSAGVATGSLAYSEAMVGIDSPGASGSTTYEVSFRNESGGITCTVNQGSNQGVIVAEEINGL